MPSSGPHKSMLKCVAFDSRIEGTRNESIAPIQCMRKQQSTRKGKRTKDISLSTMLVQLEMTSQMTLRSFASLEQGFVWRIGFRCDDDRPLSQKPKRFGCTSVVISTFLLLLLKATTAFKKFHSYVKSYCSRCPTSRRDRSCGACRSRRGNHAAAKFSMQVVESLSPIISHTAFSVEQWIKPSAQRQSSCSLWIAARARVRASPWRPPECIETASHSLGVGKSVPDAARPGNLLPY
jgi:hypothetical protein